MKVFIPLNFGRFGFDDILIKDKKTDSIMIFDELGHQSVTITGLFISVKRAGYLSQSDARSPEVPRAAL